MPRIERNADVVWEGNVARGSGAITPATGAFAALPFTLQARGVTVAPELFQALPYVATVVVLVIVSMGWTKRGLGAPAALGTPYVREEL